MSSSQDSDLLEERQLHPHHLYGRSGSAYGRGSEANPLILDGRSSHVRGRMSIAQTKEVFGPSLTTLYLGISAVFSNDSNAVTIALAFRDTAYLVGFSETHIRLDGESLCSRQNHITKHVVSRLHRYEQDNLVKFLGAGLPTAVVEASPSLCSRLWLELDIVPIVLHSGGESRRHGFWHMKRVGEQADSMARKCIMNFGPSLVPVLQVGPRGDVQTDAGFRAQLTTIRNHKDTCSPSTWEAVTHYAEKLRDKRIDIAFFSSTPQGGGVALMRHALVRFSRLIGVNVMWYVPKPRPGIFRITKNIHNILQGVGDPDQRIADDEKAAIAHWIDDNANRYWLSEGGPLRPPEEGGADMIVIDDPQMPGLIPLIKNITPDRPVLYRSHIQIRGDLVAVPGSPQADIWDFLWTNIKHADMFISHPIPEFVPHNVPREKIAYMPAATDWLDGLNKPLGRWDAEYYVRRYNLQCHSQQTTELAWPARKYIAQVARFDPSKGIPAVIDAYAEFRRRWGKKDVIDVPQLCVCGNGSVDDPDASLVFDQVKHHLESQYPELVPDCSIMRLDPNDQILNTILANAHVVLQLSTREGFEIKVSEALHAGRPVIATRAGGIPLQVQHGVNGFLVAPEDWRAVAGHLVDLFADEELHERMSAAARMGVSDEVGTVGNALSWYYLAAKWAEVSVNPGLKGDEHWVNDMAREEASQPYNDGENRLPRSSTEK